jgi:subtilisin family serine protease
MRVVCLFVCAFFFFLVAHGYKDATSKIDSKLLAFYDTHASEEVVSFLALLKSKADIASAVQGKTGEESGQIVFDELTKVSQSTQGPLLTMLRDLEVDHKAFWIVNMVQIQANETVMMMVAKHESVRELQPNFQFKVDLEVPESYADPKDAAASPYAIEWNINWVKAPQVWTRSFRGETMVVGNADTGVQWNHPALLQQYRGYGGVNNISHDYNWWDSVHTTGSSCGANTKAPCDDNGHGTHTTGTAVGDDHVSNQIGVAPRAKWIACRNMNAGLGSPATYIECMQFFIAPTDLTGNNPKPELRPHVVGNSWGCPTSEGCSIATLQEAVNNTIAAGIFMSVSAGNSGSRCSSITDPPAMYNNVFTVAASAYQSSTIASYSSRGPVTAPNANKPDITAPGSTVRSAYPTDRYASLSGTSMASPHITGVIALLWQGNPTLARNIDATSKVLRATAISRTDNACGTTTGNSTMSVRGETRNNVYGYGELDCNAAVIPV